MMGRDGDRPPERRTRELDALLPLAAAALNTALAAWMKGQVRFLSAAGKDPAARAAAMDALTDTLMEAARLHMAQMLCLDAGRCGAALPAGGAPGSASAAALRPAPGNAPCRVRGRGQGFLPGSADTFAGGLAVFQTDVRGDAGRDYLCYSVMRESRMLILIARPGTLRAGSLPAPAGRLARIAGKGTVTLCSQGGPASRFAGRFELTVRRGEKDGNFEIMVETGANGPSHHSGRVHAGPEDLPQVEFGPGARRTPPSGTA